MNTHRAISILAGIQAFEVIAGTLLITCFLKFFAPTAPHPEEYRTLAFWVREWGWILLFVPALWAFGMLKIQNKDNSSVPTAVSGYLILGCLFIFHIMAFISATRSPMLMFGE